LSEEERKAISKAQPSACQEAAMWIGYAVGVLREGWHELQNWLVGPDLSSLEHEKNFASRLSESVNLIDRNASTLVENCGCETVIGVDPLLFMLTHIKQGIIDFEQSIEQDRPKLQLAFDSLRKILEDVLDPKFNCNKGTNWMPY
jgi:hypothetical protein